MHGCLPSALSSTCQLSGQAKSRSGWLLKNPTRSSVAKLLGRARWRFFTLDFESQTLGYSRQADGESALVVGFDELLQISLEAHSRGFSLRQGLRAGGWPSRSAAAESRHFIVALCDRSLRLAAETPSEARAWVAALQAAKRISEVRLQGLWFAERGSKEKGLPSDEDAQAASFEGSSNSALNQDTFQALCRELPNPGACSSSGAEARPVGRKMPQPDSALPVCEVAVEATAQDSDQDSGSGEVILPWQSHRLLPFLGESSRLQADADVLEALLASLELEADALDEARISHHSGFAPPWRHSKQGRLGREQEQGEDWQESGIAVSGPSSPHSSSRSLLTSPPQLMVQRITSGEFLGAGADEDVLAVLLDCLGVPFSAAQDSDVFDSVDESRPSSVRPPKLRTPVAGSRISTAAGSRGQLSRGSGGSALGTWTGPDLFGVATPRNDSTEGNPRNFSLVAGLRGPAACEAKGPPSDAPPGTAGRWAAEVPAHDLDDDLNWLLSSLANPTGGGSPGLV
ncbi:unnamed protein product [Polarella glacialis]|uniref:PH domain-containing protein n=1 Tax=Polarella glacialis TaxID=89957 RepID=A0A813GI59_POLGL|nr:unnamed protein product [Polarella glacialis]